MKAERRPKSKFGLLNFDSVETLSREELKKVTGGYSTGGGGGHKCPTPDHKFYYCSVTVYNDSYELLFSLNSNQCAPNDTNAEMLVIRAFLHYSNNISINCC